jgi:hypothetical protein
MHFNEIQIISDGKKKQGQSRLTSCCVVASSDQKATSGLVGDIS